MLLALGIAVAVAGAARRLARLLRGEGLRARAAPLAGGLLGAALGAYWAFGLGVLAGSTSFTRGGYVYHTLHNLDGVERQAVVCSWWAAAWGWWYAQYVDGRRPDVTVVPKGPDDCIHDVAPREFGRRAVYLPALTEQVRRAEFVVFPSRDLWLVVGRRRPLTAGDLLKGPDERIYYFDGGARRWIPSLEVFAGRGFSWDAVQLTPEYVLSDLPEGEPLG
jgi:hypothetical protein